MKVPKRIILGVALLAIVFAGVTLAFTPGKDDLFAAGVSPEIEGAWFTMVTIPNYPPFPSIMTYARGGALNATDSSVSPALGNVYQGTWKKTGPHQFAFTLLGFQYDEAGVFIGYFRARETVQLEPGGNADNGVTSIEILDPEMNVIATDSSTTHATRIPAQ
jgi:hypothetical protein